MNRGDETAIVDWEGKPKQNKKFWMPPKRKCLQPSVKSLFGRVTEGDLANSIVNTGSEMALTKSDLLDSLAQLRADLKKDMVAEMTELRVDLNEKMAALRTAIDAAGTRVMEAEDKIQGLLEDRESQRRDMKDLQHLVQINTMKLEDLENRSRRENIRVRGLREGEEGTDVKAAMKELFASLLPKEYPEICLDRAHRVGPMREGESRGPRDILVKLSNSIDKEKILSEARKMEVVKYKDYPCVLFQDLSPVTLARRNQFRPVTEKLRQEQIRYRWLFPFGIAFEYQNKAHRTASLEEAVRILQISGGENETLSQETTSGTDSERWLAKGDGWRFQRSRKTRIRGPSMSREHRAEGDARKTTRGEGKYVRDDNS